MARRHMSEIISGAMDSHQRMAYLMSAMPVLESAGKVFDIMTDEKMPSGFRPAADILKDDAFFLQCVNLAARFDHFERATKALLGSHRK